ncbi:Glucosaminyl phosphatidylinositol (GlcN-PI) nositol acylation protein [Serendipita sp. 399]|nr:Glucosaminyl phosphatidylinositol (GlcN-PI) nositol acylation protein [Serendipita sp. 399]
MNEYKAAKESFVSDQTGSTITHINLISLIAFFSLCLYTALHTRVVGLPPTRPWALFVDQFILLVLPLLVSVTFAAQGSGLEALKWNGGFILVTATLCIKLESKIQKSAEMLPISTSTSSPLPSKTQFFPDPPAKDMLGAGGHLDRPSSVPKMPAVSTWRAHMMLMTVICILAVDFQVFPRSLVKCETFGVSVMDLGVGSFIFAQGVASALPLLKDPKHLSTPWAPKVLNSIKKTSPLLFLGLVRLILVKATDYPGEHISEYGTHWNFFLTLALVPPLQMALHPIFRHISITFVGLSVATLYQSALSLTSFQHWVLEAPRTNVMSHNKEGIASLAGYLAIHLLGLSAGLVVFPVKSTGLPATSHSRATIDISSDEANDEISSDSDNGDKAYAQDAWIDESKSRGRSKSSSDVKATRRHHSKSPTPDIRRDEGKTAIELCGYGVLYLALFIISKMVMLPVDDEGVSRRLANLQYVLWVTGFNILFLLLYICHDMYFFPFPFRKPRATDAAKQLGPTAPAALNDTGAAISGKTATSWTTAVSGRSPSTSIDFSARDGAYRNEGMLSPPPFQSSSRPGYLTPGDSVSDFEESFGGVIDTTASASASAHAASQKRKKVARKSWEGPELVLRRGFEDEGSRPSSPFAPVTHSDEKARRISRRSRDFIKMERARLLADSKPSSPELLEAINKNGLVIFLLANLLTGLINLTIPTIYLSDSAAMGILGLYLFVLCVFAWTFKDRRLVQL